MKKNLIALAILAATGSAAMAQSSVTLFGVADATVKYGNALFLALHRRAKADAGRFRAVFDDLF